MFSVTQQYRLDPQRNLVTLSQASLADADQKISQLLKFPELFRLDIEAAQGQLQWPPRICRSRSQRRYQACSQRPNTGLPPPAPDSTPRAG